ncbi:MAG: SDR family NAD(P)-dependent oxidoreductase, partial [Actinomycetota bacterium]|nr:SDR family NAD(P)-dependent oxidoreductase [Actinomycetota bacterium]
MDGHTRGMGMMDGKTVVVTGANSGIGRATASALASLGARVVVTGRDAARTESAAAAIRDETGNAEV